MSNCSLCTSVDTQPLSDVEFDRLEKVADELFSSLLVSPPTSLDEKILSSAHAALLAEASTSEEGKI